MHRSPHQALGQLNAHMPVGPQPASRLASRGQLHQGDSALHRLDRRPAALRLTGSAFNLGRIPGQVELVPPRMRTVQHVPTLAAPARFPVTSIDFSRKEVVLPYGVGRFVNAGTLKVMAGGRSADQLLKNSPAGWRFVSDETRIDLQDNRQEFRLGRLTIFS